MAVLGEKRETKESVNMAPEDIVDPDVKGPVRGVGELESQVSSRVNQG